MKRVNIFTDKSPTSEHNAELLARGIRAQDSNCYVEIKELAKTPEGATTGAVEPEKNDDENALDAEFLLFPTTGTLSLFEKRYFKQQHGNPLLEDKKYGVLMTSKTTFDGPSATPGHQLDNRLIERLAQQGMSHFPVVVERTDDDEIERAGRRLALTYNNERIA